MSGAGGGPGSPSDDITPRTASSIARYDVARIGRACAREFPPARSEDRVRKPHGSAASCQFDSLVVPEPGTRPRTTAEGKRDQGVLSRALPVTAAPPAAPTASAEHGRRRLPRDYPLVRIEDNIEPLDRWSVNDFSALANGPHRVRASQWKRRGGHMSVPPVSSRPGKATSQPTRLNGARPRPCENHRIRGAQGTG